MTLILRQISKSFGSKPILHDVDLHLPEGAIGAVLGASGSGKSTLLMLIAGLERPTSGTISWGDGVWDNGRTYVPTERRSVGLVFQDLALFPHLKVAENVAFGLTLKHAPRSARARRVEELLQLVRLEGLGDRYLYQISGGQQQRVALARALAVNPRIILFDESLSSLDAKLRREIRLELKGLLKRLGVTALFVTHDPEEALVLADRLFVMEDGRILAAGKPQDLYRTPPSRAVAETLGPASFWPADVVEWDGRRMLQIHEELLDLGPTLPPPGPYLVVLRPQSCRVVEASGPGTIPGQVAQTAYTGGRYQLSVRVAEGLFTDVYHDAPAEGQVHIAIHPSDVHFMPGRTLGEGSEDRWTGASS